MSAARAYAAVPIVVTDRPLPAQWADRLVDVRVDTDDGTPAFASLRFRDPFHQLLAGTGIGIGTPLTVSAVTVASGQQKIRVFTGEVTGLGCEYDDDGTFTVLRAQDQAHRLTQGRRLAVWPDTTLGQVAADIAARAGLRVGRVAASSAQYPRLVQPNVTDWQFLRTLGQLHGAVVTVADGALSLEPPTPAGRAPAPAQGSQDPFLLTYGENLLALDAAVSSAGPVNAIAVRGWNVGAKEPLVGQATVGASNQVEIGTTAGDLAKAFTGNGLTELVATGYALEYHLDAAATSFAASAAAAFADLVATVTGTPELTAGSPVTLAAAGPPFSGRYTVTGVSHLFDSDRGYRTRVSFSSRPRASRAAGADAASSAVPGLAIGIVADVREPDGVQSGAVKVRFPWLDDNYTSGWARTVQFGGVGGGGVISPSQGDEVLVGFEQGRLDRPYVLGGLYNGKDKPGSDSVPLTTDAGHVNRRSLSSRGGDRIDLLDTSSAPGVLLTTGDGNVQIRLDRASGALSLTAKTITIEASDNVVIKAPKVDVK